MGEYPQDGYSIRPKGGNMAQGKRYNESAKLVEKGNKLQEDRNDMIKSYEEKKQKLIDESNDYVKTLLKAINEREEDLIFYDWQDIGTGMIVKHPHNYAPWKCIYKREKM